MKTNQLKKGDSMDKAVKEVTDTILDNLDFYYNDFPCQNNFEFIIKKSKNGYKIHNYFLNNSPEKMTHELVYNYPYYYLSLIIPGEIFYREFYYNDSSTYSDVKRKFKKIEWDLRGKEKVESFTRKHLEGFNIKTNRGKNE